MKAAYGVEGVIRSVEVTLTLENGAGWHPHVHALVFTREALTPEQQAELQKRMAAWWVPEMQARTGRKPLAKRAVQVQPASHNAAEYVAKLQEAGEEERAERLQAWAERAERLRSGIGREMARGDAKTSKASGGLVPFDLLDAAADDAQAFRAWCEYVHAVKGVRAITWTRGLKKRFDLQERDDEEVLKDGAIRAPQVLFFDPWTYDGLKSLPGTLATILDLVEHGDEDVVADSLGAHLVDASGSSRAVTETPAPAPSEPFLFGAAPESTRASATATDLLEVDGSGEHCAGVSPDPAPS